MTNVAIQVGDYIIYPAMIIAIIVAVIIVTLIFMLLLKRSSKKAQRHNTKITPWQKRELPESLYFVKDEVEDRDVKNLYNENLDLIKKFISYLGEKSTWNVDDIQRMQEDAPLILSELVFCDVESSLTEYEDSEERALLCLHSIDMINGGPQYDGKKCIWITDDISEYPEQGQTSVKNRVKAVFQAAIMQIYDQMDDEIGCIDSVYEFPKYVMDYTLADVNNALQDLDSKVGYDHIETATKNMIMHGLLLSIRMNFAECDNAIDMMGIIYIRCLICLLSGKLYDDFLLLIQ